MEKKKKNSLGKVNVLPKEKHDKLSVFFHVMTESNFQTPSSPLFTALMWERHVVLKYVYIIEKLVKSNANTE